MQALPERMAATEAEVSNLLKQVLPRLERFRDCVEAGSPLTINTDSGKVTLNAQQLRRGLLEKWLPATRKRFDRANDEYFELKLSAQARVASMIRPELANATIHLLNQRLSDIRVRLDQLEDSLDGEYIATTQTLTPVSAKQAEIPTLVMEIETLKSRMATLEQRQQASDERLEKHLRLQRVVNQKVDQRFKDMQDKQDAIDPKLRYLDGRTSERTRELKALNDQMTRFNATLSLIKDEQIPVAEPSPFSQVPFRQAAAIAALTLGVGFSGLILYKSLTGESSVFTSRQSTDAPGVDVGSAKGTRYLLPPVGTSQSN